MDGTLIFCSDSILRFRSDFDDSTSIPLTSIQDAVGEGKIDPYFLLKFFHHKVAIEEGTTLSNIFFAIEPWKDLLASFLGRNVGAYIDEARKPSSIATWDIEWIGIHRSTSVLRSYEHTPMSDDEDLSSYFNRKRIPTKEFDIETGCQASGFIKGNDDRYSISGDIHEVKNLPVVLIDKQSLYAHAGKNKSLFKKSVSGVEITENANFIVGETSFSFSEMLHAIFVGGLFFDTPQYAKESYDDLKEICKDLDESLKKDSVDIVDVAAEDKEQESAAVDDNEDGEDKPKKVVVVDGAFDSVIHHMEYESKYWKRLKKKCSTDNIAPVRIGNIREAQPPEIRFHGKIID